MCSICCFLTMGIFSYNIRILAKIYIHIKYISGISGIFQKYFKQLPELLHRIAIKGDRMQRKSGTNFFALSLGLLFANLKITYASESASCRKNRALTLKRGEEAIRLFEDSAEPKVIGGSRLPLDLLFQLFKLWKKAFLLLLGNLKVILGLPV